MIETTTTIWSVGPTVVITLPRDILKDDRFPLPKKDNLPLTVNIKIEGDHIIIEERRKTKDGKGRAD